jgi:predicted nucleotidyltransferase
MNHSDDLKLFDTFNKHFVEYLVIGGTAVSFYGEYRKTKLPNGQVIDLADYDFWYNPNYKNYFRLLDAIEELGKDVTEHRDDPNSNPKEDIFKFKFEQYTLDLLPRIVAQIRFREAFERRTVVERNGVEIPFISLEDLIRDKKALGRPKDHDDIENLRRHNPPQVS